MKISLLDAVYADCRDNIQLEASYKAFMDGTGKCGKGPSLMEKQERATTKQFSRARQLGEELVREDLCDADHISAFQDQDAHVSPNSYDRHNASVGHKSAKSTGTRSGRYRPNRSKIFVDKLEMAKREKEDLKIKSVDSSMAHNRTYIIVNIRKKI